MRIGIALAAALVCSACNLFDTSDPVDVEAQLALGVMALEADDYASAITAFTQALKPDPTACQPKLGLTLAQFQRLLAQVRAFNTRLYGSFASNPDDLRVQGSGNAALIEQFLVAPLLRPGEEILSDLHAAARGLGHDDCTLRVHFPFKLAFGSFLNLNLRMGPVWSTREAVLLDGGAAVLLAAARLLMSHDLEIPPLTAISVSNNLDSAGPIPFLRTLGVVPDDAPDFLTFHEDPARRALFATIPGLFAEALTEVSGLADVASAYLTTMPTWTGEEVFWVRDGDQSRSITPGDRLVFNVRGLAQIERDPPVEIRPPEFRIGPAVQPEVLDDARELVNFGQRIYAREATPGARLKLVSLNGFFRIFGQERPFEDVLELDPLPFFLGPLQARWTRHDTNGNCKQPDGDDLECACADSRTVADPETGDPVQVSITPDIIRPGPNGPEDVCLREGLEAVDGRYPADPNPKPLRDYLPYWYRDPLLNEGRTVLGVEGEKSINIYPFIYVPPWATYGDFDHFIFGEILTDAGRVDLSLPHDCIAPPEGDRLGIVTIPYMALRDPNLNGSLFANLSVLTGGECDDSQEPRYRSWQPADRYMFNKVLAHYYNRYGRLIYDVFTFLVE